MMMKSAEESREEAKDAKTPEKLSGGFRSPKGVANDGNPSSTFAFAASCEIRSLTALFRLKQPAKKNSRSVAG